MVPVTSDVLELSSTALLLHTEDDGNSRDSSPAPFRDSSQHDLLHHIDRMLNKALKTTSKQITDKLTREIRELGQRTADLEIRMDNTDKVITAQNKELIALRDDNQLLATKLEDLENRSRRSNLRFCGIPEHILDLQSTITSILQELLPSFPIERLELVRVHRALVRRLPDGPPRDIIAKFLFFRTKESVMQATRGKSSLTFQGFEYQIFADLAPSTIAKRRELKPMLRILQTNQIPYRWGFPFRLSFSYGGKQYHGSTFSDIQHILSDLHLLPRKDHPPATSSKRRHSPTPDLHPSPSTSPQTPGKKRIPAVSEMDSDSAD